MKMLSTKMKDIMMGPFRTRLPRPKAEKASLLKRVLSKNAKDIQLQYLWLQPPAAPKSILKLSTNNLLKAFNHSPPVSFFTSLRSNARSPPPKASRSPSIKESKNYRLRYIFLLTQTIKKEEVCEEVEDGGWLFG